jgi:hypothetical protein
MYVLVRQAALEREEQIRDEFEEGWEELDRDAILLFRPGVARVLRYQAAQQKAWMARNETAGIREAVQQMEG